MKNLVKFLSLLLLVGTLSYCSKDNELQEEVTVTEYDAGVDAIIQEVLSLNYKQSQLDSATNYLVEVQGYNADELITSSHGIVYENDIVLPVEDILREARNKDLATSRTKYRYGNKITRVKNVKLGVIVRGNGSLSQKWRNSLDSAIKDWNSGKGDLSFSKRLYSKYVNNRFTQNITWVIPIDFNKFSWYSEVSDTRTVYARAYSPKNGRPGKWIFVNTDIDFYTNASSKARKQTLIHEIGHVIGFKHTGTTDGTRMTGLSRFCSKSNVASVMRKNPSSAALKLTACDKAAFDKLY